MIRKGQDILRTLNRRMDLWDHNHYDSLIQEAIQCDRPFQSRRWPKNRDEHTNRIFSRLMLQGKIRSAMRWLTERSKGSVLFPTDTTTIVVNGNETTVPVIEALKHKYLQPQAPHSSTLLHPPSLPLLEDLDVTGAHIGVVAH